jgi:hypothetical protein
LKQSAVWRSSQAAAIFEAARGNFRVIDPFASHLPREQPSSPVADAVFSCRLAGLFFSSPGGSFPSGGGASVSFQELAMPPMDDSKTLEDVIDHTGYAIQASRAAASDEAEANFWSQCAAVQEVSRALFGGWPPPDAYLAMCRTAAEKAGDYFPGWWQHPGFYSVRDYAADIVAAAIPFSSFRLGKSSSPAKTKNSCAP